jgi:uncharacterized phage protein gp47/JayE
MAINLPIDYTSRDFDGLVADLIARIPDYLPEWTNTGDSDFGILLVQLFAYMGDTLNYYIDRIAQEAFLQTATQRQSVLQIAAMLGYVPVQRTAAVIPITFDNAATPNRNGGLQFTISASAGGPVTIPVGTQVTTAAGADGSAPIIFETATARTIAIGGTDWVNATEGVTTTLESVGQSNGRDSQTFRLANPNVIFGSVVVYVTEGPGTVGSPVNVQWNYFARLSDAGPIDSAYTLSQDSSNNTYVSFGDTVSGRVPPPGTNILVTYRTGVGSSGNVGANSIVGTVQAVVGLSSVTNTVAATGGTDPESIDSMRISIPRSIKSLNRAVTVADYANLALQVPGVARATAAGNFFTSITTYIAPTNGGQPSTSLNTAVSQYLAPRSLVGVAVTVAGPRYISVNFTATVFVKAQYNQASVINACTAAYNLFYLFDNQDFGNVIVVGDMYRLLEAVVGVDYITITKMVAGDASNQSQVINIDPARTSTAGAGQVNDIFITGTTTLTGSGGIT